MSDPNEATLSNDSLALPATELTARLAQPPEAFRNASFTYIIEWVLNPMSDGCIIQHLTWEFSVFDRDNPAYRWTDDEIRHALGVRGDTSFEYWEGWTVDAENERINPVNTDTLQVRPGFADSRGTILITARAAFYAGIEVPGDFNEADDLAGALPSSLVQPLLPEPASETVVRQVKVSWPVPDDDNEGGGSNTKVELSRLNFEAEG